MAGETDSIVQPSVCRFPDGISDCLPAGCCATGDLSGISQERGDGVYVSDCVGVFLLIFVWRQSINWNRNRSVLQLETLPGRISGEFRGLAMIPVSFPEGVTFQVRLLCELTQTTHARLGNTNDPVSVLTNTQNSKSRSETRTSIVYEAKNLSTPAEHLTTPHGTSVPVTFAIPGNLPSTGTVSEPAGSDSNTGVTRHFSWSIRIRLSTESDLREIVFEIPIFDLSLDHNRLTESGFCQILRLRTVGCVSGCVSSAVSRPEVSSF